MKTQNFTRSRSEGSETARNFHPATDNTPFMHVLLIGVRIIAISMFLLSLFGIAFGQEQTRPASPAADPQQTKSAIVSFSSLLKNGKVFHIWLSKAETSRCLYIVERSSDGKHFEAVGMKEGFVSPVELMYCWIDKNPPVGTSYFRLKKVYNESSQEAEFTSQNVIVNEELSSPVQGVVLSNSAVIQ